MSFSFCQAVFVGCRVEQSHQGGSIPEAQQNKSGQTVIVGYRSVARQPAPQFFSRSFLGLLSLCLFLFVKPFLSAAALSKATKKTASPKPDSGPASQHRHHQSRPGGREASSLPPDGSIIPGHEKREHRAPSILAGRLPGSGN